MIRSTLSIAAAFLISVAVQAAELGSGAYSIGVSNGDVSFRLSGSEDFRPAPAGTALPQGAVVKTGEKSSATIVFSSGSVAGIGANSVVEVSKFLQEPFKGALTAGAEPSVSDTEIVLVEGELISNVAKLRKGSKYSVTSPVGAAGVRGTIFFASYNSKTGEGVFEVAEGSIVILLDGGETVTLGAGQGWSSATGIYTLTPGRIAQIQDAVGESGSVYDLTNVQTGQIIPLTDLIGVSVN